MTDENSFSEFSIENGSVGTLEETLNCSQGHPKRHRYLKRSFLLVVIEKKFSLLCMGPAHYSLNGCCNVVKKIEEGEYFIKDIYPKGLS